MSLGSLPPIFPVSVPERIPPGPSAETLRDARPELPEPSAEEIIRTPEYLGVHRLGQVISPLFRNSQFAWELEPLH